MEPCLTDDPWELLFRQAAKHADLLEQRIRLARSLVSHRAMDSVTKLDLQRALDGDFDCLAELGGGK